jgi:hypothetical protein
VGRVAQTCLDVVRLCTDSSQEVSERWRRRWRTARIGTSSMLAAGLAVALGGRAATTTGAAATGVGAGFAPSASAFGSEVARFVFKDQNDNRSPGPWKHRKPGEHDQSRRRNKRRKLPPVRARQKRSDHDGVLWEQR